MCLGLRGEVKEEMATHRRLHSIAGERNHSPVTSIDVSGPHFSLSSTDLPDISFLLCQHTIMNEAVLVFQEHTRHFFGCVLGRGCPNEEFRRANDYFMALKQDRAGLEVSMQVVRMCEEGRALVFACNIMLDFLSEYRLFRRWNMFRPEERRSLYECLSSILSTRGPALLTETQLAAEKLCEALGRMSRQFWSEDQEAKKVQILALMLVAKPGFELIGCLLEQKLIEEMSPNVLRPRAQHQRNSQVFRDDYLPQAFKVGSELFLQSLRGGDIRLALAALNVLVAVLSFDTSEETGVWKSVLISSNSRKDGSWRLLEDPETPNCVFQLYCHCHEQGRVKDAPLCFQFLALIVSVHRYFYANLSLREQLLAATVSGVRLLITKGIGLADADCLLALCKLCESLASCAVHIDIKNEELVQGFLSDAYTLTLSLIEGRQSDNAVFFLLQFWARLVPTLNSSPGTSAQLKSAILRIVEVYLKACGDSIEQEMDKELMDDAMIGVVSDIIRADTVGIGVRCLEGLRDVAARCASAGGNLQQLQFLIKLTSGFMSENRKLSSKKLQPKSPREKKPPVSVLSFDETQLFGQLSAELFKICILARDNPSNRQLLLSCVGFLRSFQTLFLSESTSSQLSMTFAHLVSSLCLQDENAIAELWIQLTLHYLHIACCEPLDHELISQTVWAFFDLIEGSKRFRDFGSQTEYILVGGLHLKPQFLANLLSSLVMKKVALPYDSSLFSARSKLYASAAKLLFWTHKTLDGARVEDWLKVHFQSHNSADFPAYLAWIYEQKGMVQAITLSGDFQTWSEWFLDGPSADLLSKLQAAPGNIPLIYGALKLASESSCNRVNRIIFPEHSMQANDFARFLISVLSIYFTQTFAVQVTSQYEERYKPFCHAVATVTHLISGRYCNVSNFITSADPSFRVTFEAALHCVRRIPVEDLLSYQRQFQCVWDMIEIATQYEGLLPLLLSLSPEDLGVVLELPHEGLQSLSNSARISSANIINNLIAFISKPAKASLQPLLDDFRMKSDAYMKKLLRSLLVVVLGGFLSNSSLVSKALLGLINHQQAYFLSLKEEVVAAQQTHLQDMLRTLLDSLWTGTNFVWWQLTPQASYTVVDENLKGARVFDENLNKLLQASGRISWT